jgi:hypothetical protein
MDGECVDLPSLTDLRVCVMILDADLKPMKELECRD